MARPRFAADAYQRRAIRDVEQAARRIQEADARLTEAIVAAKKAGVPIEHIAPAAGITVKTVYARIARSDDTDHERRSATLPP